MAELKHIKTFENFELPTEEEVVQEEIVEEQEVLEDEELNEGVFDSLKTKIDKFLEDPKEGKEDALLKKAFAKTFAKTPKVKEEVLNSSHDVKVDILKKAAIKLADPKTSGVLKLQKIRGEWKVGGVGFVAGTGGGRRG